MEANQVLPAIPRQKVRNIETGEIAEVLGMCSDQSHQINVVTRTNGAFWNQGWEISNCEPVPEEPRPFRCGDRVAYDYPDGTTEYTTILAIRKVGDEKIIFTHGDVSGIIGQRNLYRHATPEELKYFN